MPLGIAVLALILSIDSSATDSAPVLTLGAAVATALHEQPLLEAYKQRKTRARAQYVQARAGALPFVNLAAQIIEASNRSSTADFVGVTDFPSVSSAVNLDNRLNALVGFGAHYQLLDFGYTSGRIEAAQAEAEAAEAFESQIAQDVILRVCEAYLHAVAATETYEIAQDSQRRAQAHHNLADAGVKSGLRPRIDILRSDAELAAADLSVIRAKNAVLVSRSALDTAIGWVPRSYTLASPTTSDAPPPSEQEVVDLARANRPDLAAYHAQERAADKQVRSAFALNFPQIVATGSATWRGVSELPRTFNWDVGLVLTLPIFNGFAISGQTEAAEALAAETRAKLRGLEQFVLNQIQRARDTLLSAAEAVKAAHVQVTGAHATLDQAEMRYKQGLGDIVELTDAQTQFDLAQQSLVQSELTRALSDVQLQHVYGGLRVPTSEAEGSKS